MLFNLWNYNPPYQSASDGMMIEQLLKSMEEKDVSESHVTTADGTA